MGFAEMQNEELEVVDGGKADTLTVLGAVGLGLTVVGMIATGPVGIVAGIIGGELGAISTICSFFS